MCIPIILGPVAHTKPEEGGNHAARQCPRCHNQSVAPFQRRTWFELYWLPARDEWTALNPDFDPTAPKQDHQQQQQLQQQGYTVGYGGQAAGAKV
ncbi:hypothetical protein JCM8547_006079 [Rhodosporidiobolus lusitaniae]